VIEFAALMLLQLRVFTLSAKFCKPFEKINIEFQHLPHPDCVVAMIFYHITGIGMGEYRQPASIFTLPNCSFSPCEIKIINLIAAFLIVSRY